MRNLKLIGVIVLGIFLLSACGGVRQMYQAEKLQDYKAKNCTRNISIGDHPIDVVKVCGRPDKINRSTGSWGIHEQWVYKCWTDIGRGTRIHMERMPVAYLYFKNDSLTSWQDR